MGRYFDTDGSGNIAFKEFAEKIDASAQDTEKEQQDMALGFFKKVVKGKKNRMIQAYRMADDQLASQVSRKAVEEIMANVIGVKAVDARRVCTKFFGEADVIPYTSFLKLLTYVEA